MKIIILGDVHGQWEAANRSVNDALFQHPDAIYVVQMGDLGDGWPHKGNYARWKPDFDLPIFVVPGNHENYDALERGEVNAKLNWMDRGEVWSALAKKFMFFGGATSPDFKDRTIGVNWWPQETITYKQLQTGLAVKDKIDVIFAHERASVFSIPSEWRLPYVPNGVGASDRQALTQLVTQHLPDFYFHGHWHFGHHGLYEVANKAITVISCPVIDNNNIKWTVFDGIQIWRNWK